MGNKNESWSPFIVNTNTNIIMKLADGVLKRETVTKKIYIKVRANGELDFNKSAPRHRIKQHISKGYVIECRSYNQARYEQAIVRMKKSNGTMEAHWREIAEAIQDKYPEDLI